MQRLVVGYDLPSVPWLGGSLAAVGRVELADCWRAPARVAGVVDPIIARRVALGLSVGAVAARLRVGVADVERVESRPAHVRGDADGVALRRRMVAAYRYQESLK